MSSPLFNKANIDVLGYFDSEKIKQKLKKELQDTKQLLFLVQKEINLYRQMKEDYEKASLLDDAEDMQHVINNYAKIQSFYNMKKYNLQNELLFLT